VTKNFIGTAIRKRSYFSLLQKIFRWLPINGHGMKERAANMLFKLIERQTLGGLEGRKGVCGISCI